MHEQFLSNTYLVADRPGGTAALVDAGGPVEPLLAAIEREGLTLGCVLLTHRHHDHVAELGAVRERYPEAVVYAHPLEEIAGAEALPGGRRALRGPGRVRHAGADGAGLRRRPQGLGALVRRARRHRARLPGPAGRAGGRRLGQACQRLTSTGARAASSRR